MAKGTSAAQRSTRTGASTTSSTPRRKPLTPRASPRVGDASASTAPHRAAGSSSSTGAQSKKRKLSDDTAPKHGSTSRARPRTKSRQEAGSDSFEPDGSDLDSSDGDEGEVEEVGEKFGEGDAEEDSEFEVVAAKSTKAKGKSKQGRKGQVQERKKVAPTDLAAILAYNIGEVIFEGRSRVSELRQKQAGWAKSEEGVLANIAAARHELEELCGEMESLSAGVGQYEASAEGAASPVGGDVLEMTTEWWELSRRMKLKAMITFLVAQERWLEAQVVLTRSAESATKSVAKMSELVMRMFASFGFAPEPEEVVKEHGNMDVDVEPR